MKRCILLLLPIMLLTGCGSSADIGIIGGADGPTAIVVGTPAETVTCTEMPLLPGIPVPPGIFAEGWEDTDDGMIYVKTIAVDEATFKTYTEQTLTAAGYTAISPDIVEEVTGDRVDAVLCDGEEYSIQLLYAYAEETLTVTITPKN